MEVLRDFMDDQLNELFNAEIQLKMVVEKMAYQTSNEALRHSFELHAKKLEAQFEKLDQIFTQLGVVKNDRREPKIMEAIGNEVQSFIESAHETEIRDAGFIALIQKAKHYEISLLGTIREYANVFGNREAENLLTEILIEVKQADLAFTDKARTGINQRASNKEAVPKRFVSTGTAAKSGSF